MQNETNTAEDRPPGVIAKAPWRLEDVAPLPGYQLRVRFMDGVEGLIDMSGLVFSDEAGVFASLRDPAVFEQVYIELGAATWPGEIDLAPDAMYEEIKLRGKWAPE